MDAKKAMPEKFYAIDFETYYDSDYSVSKMTYKQYVTDPKFDAYLVAVKGPDIQYVGPPDQFSWEVLRGASLISHNVRFDKSVFEQLQRQKVIPSDLSFNRQGEWVDSADLAAFLRSDRRLEGAARHLLGVIISKDPRSYMRGKKWRDLTEENKKIVKDYAMHDAELSYKLFMQHHAKWPAIEQRISYYNRVAQELGIPIDLEYTEKAVKDLKRQLFEAEEKIPWTDKGRPLSPKFIYEQARKDGIKLPAVYREGHYKITLDQREVVVQDWFQKYSERFPWIQAIVDYRRINSLLQRMKHLLEDTEPDGFYRYQLKYFGAHTGRFSGGGGSGKSFNVHNPPRKVMYGVDIRKAIRAPKGYTLLIKDFEQIEARLLLWVAGYHNILEKLTSGEIQNLYEAEALINFGFKDVENLSERNPALYLMIKSLVLGCGYGMGSRKFEVMAPIYSGGAYTPDIVEAEKAVNLYRSTHPKVVQYWREHQQKLLRSVLLKKSFHTYKLASGRKMIYFYPTFRNDEIVAQAILGRPPIRLYGGKLTENEIQALARDVFCWAWDALEQSGVLEKTESRVLFTTHDEYVIMTTSGSEKALKAKNKELDKVIRESCPWLGSKFPLSLKTKISDVYLK